jgi:hypothetical protein
VRRARLIERDSSAVKPTEIECLSNVSGQAADAPHGPIWSRSKLRVWARHRLQELAQAKKLGVRATPSALGVSITDRPEA